MDTFPDILGVYGWIFCWLMALLGKVSIVGIVLSSPEKSTLMCFGLLTGPTPEVRSYCSFNVQSTSAMLSVSTLRGLIALDLFFFCPLEAVLMVLRLSIPTLYFDTLYPSISRVIMLLF